MRVFFEGPQGSGKTTISKLLSYELSQKETYIPLFRGIPDGVFLKDHTEEENWERALEIMQACPAIFDRSPLSITVFDAQESVIGPQVWDYHLPIFFSHVRPSDLLVFLECPPEKSFRRQGIETVCSLESLTEAQKEYERYSQLWRIIEARGEFNKEGLKIMCLKTEEREAQTSVDEIIKYLYSEEAFSPYIN